MAAYLRLGLALVISLGAARSLAQGLNDPTRPPWEGSGGADLSEFPANPSPAQVVIISKDRRQATINGRTVSLGGRYGDATLVRISDEEIVLRKGDATEVIKLYSSVHRRKHWPAALDQTETAGRPEERTHEAN